MPGNSLAAYRSPVDTWVTVGGDNGVFTDCYWDSTSLLYSLLSLDLCLITPCSVLLVRETEIVDGVFIRIIVVMIFEGDSPIVRPNFYSQPIYVMGAIREF